MEDVVTLEEMNYRYGILKKSVEDAKNLIQQEEAKIKTLNDEIKIKEAEKIIAEVNGDQQKVDNLKNDIKVTKDAIKKSQASLKIVKNELLKDKSEISQMMTAIKQSNPELSAHLDNIVKTKAERQVKKLNKEKEIINKQKENKNKEKEKIDKKINLIDQIMLLTNNSVPVQNALKGMLKPKMLKDELESLIIPGSIPVQYTDPTRADEIKNTELPAAEAKYDVNKNTVMSAVKKYNGNIKEEDLKEFTNKVTVSLNKNGEIDINTTLNKSRKNFENEKNIIDKDIRVLSKKEKSMDKRIADYTKVRDNNNVRVGVGQVQQTTPAGQDKPKWYEFRKRFNNWRQRRNQRALPTTTSEENKYSIENEDFRKSMKYEIVQDTVENVEKESLREAKQTRTQGDDGSR